MIQNYEYTLLIFLISFLLILIGWKLKKISNNVLIYYYNIRGKSAEKKAYNILTRNNYTIIKEQEVIYGFLYENEIKVMYKIIPDFLVEKDGIRMFAEVKTGKSACISNRLTRRQLLEYSHLLDTNISLLIDTEKGIIKKIKFE